MKSYSNSQIRIFVDAHVFDGEYQGTLTYIKELYLNLLSNNPEILIYFGSCDVQNVKNVFGSFSNARFVQYSSVTSFKRIFIEVPRIINEIGCTHAHFQYIMPFNKNKKCQYIVTIHDVLFNDFPNEFSFFYRIKRNLLFLLSAKRADYLLTVSDYSKKKISEHYKIKPDDIVVIPNAVSEEFFQFDVSKGNAVSYISKKYDVRKFILYISRIEPRKNQIMLLRAFLDEQLWKKGYVLVLIGSNTLESDLFSIIGGLRDNIKKSIRWIEQVDSDELKYFLKAADFFVYPSKAEGFGIPPLEAAALCTPVLCSNATAMKDFDFFDPYMFSPDDYDEFLKRFTDILMHYKSIDLLSIQNEVKNKYSWSQGAKTFSDRVL